MRAFTIVFLAAGILHISPRAFAQRLSVGVIGGGSLTDSFRTESTPSSPDTELTATLRYSASKDYILGAMVELSLLPHWSVEVDGMYRTLHFTTAGLLANGSLVAVSPSPVITWEFPVLAKYRFDWWRVKPFAELGPSFRTAGNLNGTNPSHVGFTSGVGVEMQVQRVKIAPVLRYTRWASDPTNRFQPKSNPDQLELLVGFSVSPESEWRPLGQHFSVGVVAGIDVTDGVRPQSFNIPGFSFSSHAIRAFIAGPTVELKLRKHLSLEADAVYHPLRSEGVAIVNGMTGRTNRSGIATWELPALAKYRFPSHFVKPFIEAGPSFRLPSAGVSNYGVAAGVGFETRLRLLRIAPSVRYTHWAPDTPPRDSGAIRNQAEFLVGFSL